MSNAKAKASVCATLPASTSCATPKAADYKYTVALPALKCRQSSYCLGITSFSGRVSVGSAQSVTYSVFDLDAKAIEQDWYAERGLIQIFGQTFYCQCIK
jgi:hypothetical protein